MSSATDNNNTQVEENSARLLQAKALQCTRHESLLFDDLSFTLSAGEVLQIDGANGSGKTSLIRILSGLAEADEGEVLWCEKEIQTYRSEYLQDLIYVAHTNGIKMELTGLENLDMTRALYTRLSKTSSEQALALFGLLDYSDRAAINMSSGQRRRLALSRLLLGEARLWLVDEPFTSLDEDSKTLVRDMLVKHTDSGGCVVITTHEAIDWQHAKVKKIEL
jgi:heme exporter protein A